MALNPNKPVGAPDVPSDRPPPPAAPAKDGPRTVHVDDSDALVVKVKKGDTLFQMARLFADDANNDGSITGKELTGFVDGIKRANGGNPAMAIDQPIKIPNRNASYLVQMATAVQKFMATYADAGMGKADDYVWHDLSLGEAPDGWSGVRIARKDGTTEQFMVSDNMMDGDDGAADLDKAVMTVAQFVKKFNYE
jgi:hypothetical protein